MMKRRTQLFCLACLLLTAGQGQSAEPWHLAGWSTRAVVEIVKRGDAGDTAAVKLICQGRIKSDGGDIRVVDAKGQQQPFQITFQDARRYCLISFRATNAQPKQKYFVYFGNSKASANPLQVNVSDQPGVGPPKGKWIPKSGLVFSTRQRPIGPNPKTVAELKTMLAASKTAYGGRYQQRVADGHNPFGPSDHYMSVYRGWIRIAKPGKYKFCTASNEASFSFLDGKKLVHWPGRHTSERGLRGEKNTEVQLSAGLHYLEYYHEEVMLKQVAFLGWSPPGAAAGYFSAIPAAIYTQPHESRVTLYETTGGPVPLFEPKIVDTIWPIKRHEGQYTRVQFAVLNPKAYPPATQFIWGFGDGHTAAGVAVEHVYLLNGNYDVRLQIKGPGQTTIMWPLSVFDVQHVSDEIRQGRPPDYAKIVKAYDPSKLNAASLKQLAHLYDESDQPREAIRTGKAFIKRFGQSQKKLAPEVNRMIALCALELGVEGVDTAIASFQATLTPLTPIEVKLDSLSRLIRLIGVDRAAAAKTKPLFEQVEQIIKDAKTISPAAKEAYRGCLNSLGDVKLWHGKRAAARDLYKRVEVLSGRYIPAQVRSARVGAHPNSIRSYLRKDNFGAALEIVNKWESKFPTEKVKGQTFYWRGKILAMRAQHRRACQFLQQSIKLSIGSVYESEARWILAISLEKSGQVKQSRRELAKLAASGLNNAFTELAKKKLLK